jgi:hypothetical protein
MKVRNSFSNIVFPIMKSAIGLGLLAASGGAQNGQFRQPGVDANVDTAAIRPFRINISAEALVDLRRRIAMTKWPEREPVEDATQGVQLATMQKLAHYWSSDYDWREVEARLNALPQFVTTIEGLDIHFIHPRSGGCGPRRTWKWLR